MSLVSRLRDWITTAGVPFDRTLPLRIDEVGIDGIVRAPFEIDGVTIAAGSRIVVLTGTWGSPLSITPSEVTHTEQARIEKGEPFTLWRRSFWERVALRAQGRALSPELIVCQRVRRNSNGGG